MIDNTTQWIIHQSFGETATIQYSQCIEIVNATTTALQSERNLALLFLFAFVCILIIKYFWKK